MDRVVRIQWSITVSPPNSNTKFSMGFRRAISFRSSYRVCTIMSSISAVQRIIRARCVLVLQISASRLLHAFSNSLLRLHVRSIVREPITNKNKSFQFTPPSLTLFYPYQVDTKLCSLCKLYEASWRTEWYWQYRSSPLSYPLTTCIRFLVV
jgi:hypothetical protein